MAMAIRDKDRAAREIAFLFIGDLKSGAIDISDRLDESQYRACLAEYKYSHFVYDGDVRSKVAWAVNGWATKEIKKRILVSESNSLAVKIANTFCERCIPGRRYSYAYLCNFIEGCLGRLDTKLTATVASLVDYKLSLKNVSPLIGYDDDYIEIISFAEKYGARTIMLRFKKIAEDNGFTEKVIGDYAYKNPLNDKIMRFIKGNPFTVFEEGKGYRKV